VHLDRLGGRLEEGVRFDACGRRRPRRQLERENIKRSSHMYSTCYSNIDNCASGYNLKHSVDRLYCDSNLPWFFLKQNSEADITLSPPLASPVSTNREAIRRATNKT
jgi:hypothetical protein